MLKHYRRHAAMILALGTFATAAAAVKVREGGGTCGPRLVATPMYVVARVTSPAGEPALIFRGGLDLDLHYAEKFVHELRKLPRHGPVTLVFNGRGGSFHAHRHVARAIDAHLRPHFFRKSRNALVTTYVPEGGQCTGNCLRLFMMGDRRVAHPDARFGFCAPIGIDRASRVLPELRRWGMRGPLLRKLRDAGAFADRDHVTYLTAAELAESNLLTEPASDLSLGMLDF